MSELVRKTPIGYFDYLQVFMLSDNQPITCPHCDVRTDNKTSDHTLICACPSCSFTFRVEFE